MKKGENLSGDTPDRYWLGSVGRACLLLKAFADDVETLSLADIVERTGLEKTIAFRLIYTLEKEGFLRQAGPHRYSRNIEALEQETIPHRVRGGRRRVVVLHRRERRRSMGGGKKTRDRVDFSR